MEKKKKVARAKRVPGPKKGQSSKSNPVTAGI